MSKPKKQQKAELSPGFLVFDTETTGLTLHPNAPIEKQPEIIEFGGSLLSCEDGQLIEQLTILIKPKGRITDEITKITGISEDDVRDAPSFAEAWPQIAAFIGRAKAALAHNEPFDYAMFEIELRRAQLKTIWPQRFCTIGLYRAQFGFDPKLVNLYESVIGKPLDQKHRAQSDVDALVEIVQAGELWRLA